MRMKLKALTPVDQDFKSIFKRLQLTKSNHMGIW